MNPFSLYEYLKNPNRKVVTRDGSAVRIICTDRKGKYPVVALVECGCDSEDIFSFTNDGKYFICEIDKLDLFFAPEKHERWVNLYKSESGEYFLGASICTSKEHAEVVACRNCIATCKIEWEE